MLIIWFRTGTPPPSSVPVCMSIWRKWGRRGIVRSAASSMQVSSEAPPQGCGAHVADFYGLSGGHQQCRINPLTVATQAMRRLCLVTWGSRIPVLNQPMAAVGITHGSQTKFGWAFILTTNRFSWESVTGPRSPREINGWMEIWTQVCSFLVQHYNHNTTLALYSQVQSTHVDVHTVMSA